MTKEEIIEEIKRIAKESGGKAPGAQKFASITGLRKSDWYPKIWLRWGDAIKEAELSPNEYISAYDKIYLIQKYIELIRELGHFPIEGELRIKRKTDKGFPSHSGFSQLGSKNERIRKIVDFCKNDDELKDIIPLCPEIQNSKEDDFSEGGVIGYVYLIQHGSRNEYKIGRTNNPIRREGEIRLELPEKVNPIHYIKTDDPAGIEKYWHSRFSKKRKEGEWFALSKSDIHAFKKWKKIY